MTPGEIGFRPVERDDYALLADWLQRAHWREWWGEPETELGYIRDMVEGRRNRRDDFYKRPAGHIDLCNVPLPVRVAGS